MEISLIVWNELGIAPTHDEPSIRRAYAKRLKALNVEAQPERFQTLRQAYEQALYYAQRVVEGDQIASPRRFFAEAVTAFEERSSCATSDAIDSDSREQRIPTELPGTDTAAGIQRSDATGDTLRGKWQRAEQLIAELLHLLDNQGEEAVIAAFHRLNNGDELIDIDLRELFEQSLIQQLCTRPKVAKGLLRILVNVFGWLAPVNGLADRYPSLYWQLSPQLKVMEQYEAMQGLTEILIAPKVLLGSYRPFWFFYLALRKRNLVAVTELLDDMEQSAQELFHTEIDPRTVRWWRWATKNSRMTAMSIMVRFLLNTIFIKIVN